MQRTVVSLCGAGSATVCGCRPEHRSANRPDRAGAWSGSSISFIIRGVCTAERRWLQRGGDASPCRIVLPAISYVPFGAGIGSNCRQRHTLCTACPEILPERQSQRVRAAGTGLGGTSGGTACFRQPERENAVPVGGGSPVRFGSVS